MGSKFWTALKKVLMSGYDMLNFLVLLYFAFTLHTVTGVRVSWRPYIIAKMQFNPCIIEPSNLIFKHLI